MRSAVLVAVGLLASPVALMAQAAAATKIDSVATQTAANSTSINFVWTLVAGFLVMFMQAGFALVETGFTRSKNAGHTMTMNFMVYAIGMLAYWAVGFALQGFFLTGVAYNASIFAYFLFQMVFMDTTATIPTGAAAERWKFSAFCIFTVFVGAFIYPIFANWVWGNGW